MPKLWRCFYILLALIVSALNGYGQGNSCPLNIDFETGTFLNWQCYKGTTSVSGGANVVNVSKSSPINNVHTIIPKSAAVDPYGNFPIAAPDGSSYSVKLGNDGVQSQAERLVYTLTVPASQADFVLTYQYAVVLQDPGHSPAEQPRFTAKVLDVASNTYISCSSFDYIATANLPGFKNGSNSVVYKSWTPVTINLSGYQGKQIQLEFTTADCTLGGHFGYAYIDINNSCSSVITGLDFCSTAPAIILKGPDGYDQYNWFNADKSKALGTGNPLVLTTLPQDGAKIVLDVVPYAGFGCPNTVSAIVHKHTVDLKITDPPGVCFPNKVDISTPPVTDGSNDIVSLSYWKDSLATTALSNYTAVADSGIYYIKAINTLGCFLIKPVLVQIHKPPVLKVTDPRKVYQPETVDVTLDAVTAGSTKNLTYAYYSDSTLLNKVPDAKQIKSSGKYYIVGTNINGCADTAAVNIVIALRPDILVPKAFTPTQVNNNRLYPFLIGIQTLTNFTIYNRWGNIVFQGNQTTAANGWDGIFKGTVAFLDTVTWVADGYDFVGNAVHRTGNTLILK